MTSVFKGALLAIALVAMVGLGCSSEGSDDDGAVATVTPVGTDAGAAGPTGGGPGGPGTPGGGGGSAADAGDAAGSDAGEPDGAGSTDDGGTTGDGGRTGPGDGLGPPLDTGGNGSGFIPDGTWLFHTKSGACADYSLMSTTIAKNGYAVLKIDPNGVANFELHNQEFEDYLTLTFDQVDLSEEGVYRVAQLETVVEPEGSNCATTINLSLSLTEGLGGLGGTLDYSEVNLGGGCFADGCDGSLIVEATKMGGPPDLTDFSAEFGYGYDNVKDGVSEVGLMALYPDPNHPHFVQLDIFTPGSTLQTIRGRKYIVGGNTLRGYAFLPEYDGTCINEDIWDITLNLTYGPGFGGPLEHTFSFHQDCDDFEEIHSVGEMFWDES